VQVTGSATSKFVASLFEGGKQGTDNVSFNAGTCHRNFSLGMMAGMACLVSRIPRADSAWLLCAL
jgi:hypothetical protein